MREEEIKRELELGVRALLEADERSKEDAIDDFKRIRILESSFNRLFLAVEHLCNALILAETGNFSPKHFGDIKKFKDLKERYKTDFQAVYQDAYTFRGYADYRKFPEIEEKFDAEHLREQLSQAKQVMDKIFEIIGKKMDLSYLIEKTEGQTEEDQEKYKKES